MDEQEFSQQPSQKYSFQRRNKKSDKPATTQRQFRPRMTQLSGGDMYSQQNYQSMMDFQQTQSFELQESPPLQYEQCQHCHRNFFKGKLKYHLKLCTQDNPMIISPKKNSREPSSRLANQDKTPALVKEDRKCEECLQKISSSQYEKHVQLCLVGRDKGLETPEREEKVNKKSSTDVNFKERDGCTLPVIKVATRQGHSRQIKINEPYQVKLREQLSCFRRAQEIKQIQCPACERIFSKQASLRHVPICQTLRNNQKLSIALKKRTRVNRSLGPDFMHRSKAKKSLLEDRLKGSQQPNNPENTA